MKYLITIAMLTLVLSAGCRPVTICVPGEGCDTVYVCD
jgi:hypothetical protein